ncbi:MAG: SCO family protein [Dehalococcoidia bacterium]
MAVWRGAALAWLTAAVLVAAGCSSGARLVGTDLSRTPAPDFSLHDAAGAPFSLRETRGKAVWLMFLYTHCPDICPAIAGKVAVVAKQLGPDAAKVEFVAVSVDPLGDTPDSVRTFTADHGLDALGSRWRYLLGTSDELAAVWHDYGIGAEPRPAAIAALPGGDAPAVDHNTEMYMIDRQGRERVLVHADDSTDTLTANLRRLAGGG